jgi:hypothetical protein
MISAGAVDIENIYGTWLAFQGESWWCQESLTLAYPMTSQGNMEHWLTISARK